VLSTGLQLQQTDQNHIAISKGGGSGMAMDAGTSVGQGGRKKVEGNIN